MATAGDAGVAAAAASGVGAYEAKRLQRIQQNQQVLQSLGIALQPRERKRRVSTRDPETVVEPPRRSSRLQQQQPTTTALELDDPLLDLDSAPRRKPRVRGPEYTPVKLPKIEATAQSRQLSGKLSRQSCMMLDMDFAAFHDRWLGKQIWPKGKATVMEGMCPLHVPTFSRISGIQQWRNSVVLFVNVQGASGYDNSFTEVSSPTLDHVEPTTVHFRWFAQERQTEASPAIVRLLAAQVGDRKFWLDGAATTKPSAPATDEIKAETNATATTTTPEPVLLYIRHVDGPYIYCGRLGYLGHLTAAKPIEFRWQLLDVDKIQWSEVKQLLDAAGQDVDAAVVGAPSTTKQEL